jgi:hypothetical protein
VPTATRDRPILLKFFLTVAFYLCSKLIDIVAISLEGGDLEILGKVPSKEGGYFVWKAITLGDKVVNALSPANTPDVWFIGDHGGP